MKIPFYLFLTLLAFVSKSEGQMLEPNFSKDSTAPIVTNGQNINFKSAGINYGLEFKHVYKVGSSYFAVANTIEMGYFFGILINSYETVNQGVYLFQLDNNMNLISKQSFKYSSGQKGYDTDLLGNYILGSKMISFFSINNRIKGKKYIMCNSFDLNNSTKKSIKIAELKINSEDKFEFYMAKENSKIQINHLFVSTIKKKTTTTKDTVQILLNENLETEFVTSNVKSNSKYQYLGDFQVATTENVMSAYLNGSKITLVDNSNKIKNSPEFELGKKKVKFNSYFRSKSTSSCHILLDVLGPTNVPIEVITIHAYLKNDSLFIDTVNQYNFKNIFTGNLYKRLVDLNYSDQSNITSNKYPDKQINFNRIIFDPQTQKICVIHELFEHYTRTERTENKHYNVDSKGNRTYSHSTWDTKIVHYYTSGPLICSFLNKDSTVSQHFLDISQTHRNMSLPIDLTLNVTADYKYHMSSGFKIYRINFETNTINYFNYTNNNSNKMFQQSSVVNVGDELIIIDQKGFKNVSFSRVTFPD